MVAVGFQESLEIQKVTLGSFRAKKALKLASWADLGVKHEIELYWCSDWVSSFRRTDSKIYNELCKVVPLIIVKLWLEGVILFPRPFHIQPSFQEKEQQQEGQLEISF